MVLQICVEGTRNRLALSRAEDDLASAARAAEDHLADTQSNEQPQGATETVDECLRMLVSLGHPLDHLPCGVRDENAARGVDRLEHHHGEIPPLVARDEVANEAERRSRQRRSARRSLKFS